MDSFSKIVLMVTSPTIWFGECRCTDPSLDILDVSLLDEPKLVKHAIDRLVMRPEENKETIKAIVKTYTDSGGAGQEHFSADFIHGKGEGQIFLLHGPPGTGKTLTAGA
jgi:SpoVK/Ycf46/Vps4 family AAA+-type ATPase